MKSKFRKCQRVICTHYKDKPTCIITDILVDDDMYVNIWVKEVPNKTGTIAWWGPESWFKALPKKRKISAAKARYERAVLCDGNVPGCTCNQAASVRY